MKPGHVDMLRQALPYINKFKGKTFVIKIGGEVAADAKTLDSFCEEVALCAQVGIRIVLVHGGGKQASAMGEKLGLEPKLVDGRRITDDGTLDIVKMVFAGKINVEILSSLQKAGISPVGLSGVDGNMIHATRRAPKKIHDKWVDFGHVGDIDRVDVRLLETLLSAGFVPVLSSLGADGDGAILNINADTVAARFAQELRAEKLILASNVEGIYVDGSLVPRLSSGEVTKLVKDGALTGGMIPKTQEAFVAIEAGVGSVHIISGVKPSALLTEVFTTTGCGTMLRA